VAGSFKAEVREILMRREGERRSEASNQPLRCAAFARPNEVVERPGLPSMACGLTNDETPPLPSLRGSPRPTPAAFLLPVAFAALANAESTTTLSLSMCTASSTRAALRPVPLCRWGDERPRFDIDRTTAGTLAPGRHSAETPRPLPRMWRFCELTV
jgi:hypothetical protein